MAGRIFDKYGKKIQDNEDSFFSKYGDDESARDYCMLKGMLASYYTHSHADVRARMGFKEFVLMEVGVPEDAGGYSTSVKGFVDSMKSEYTNAVKEIDELLDVMESLDNELRKENVTPSFRDVIGFMMKKAVERKNDVPMHG